MAKRQTGNIYKVDYFMGCDSCASEEKCVILKSLKLRCGLVGGVEMKITKCRKFEEKEVEPVEPDTIVNEIQEANWIQSPYDMQSQLPPYDWRRSQGCSNTIPLSPIITTTELSDSERASMPDLIQDNDKIDDTVEMESTMKRLWGRLKNVK